jgi:hypothetical protein
MKIAIVGAGWYGCHLALKLKKAGHSVVLLEKNSDISMQISGKFGIRLHLSPHYPRSDATTNNCRNNFEKFKNEYSDLIVEHDYSIYGLGNFDADGLPSKKGFYYVDNGILATCIEEITEKPGVKSRDTCSLKTYKTILTSTSLQSSTFWISSDSMSSNDINLNHPAPPTAIYKNRHTIKDN